MATRVSDELWQDFHTVVNMTSRELEDWLRTRDAREWAEPLPDQAGAGGNGIGRRVAEILGKRRGDLTERDARVMERVVELVASQRDEQMNPKAGDRAWRQRLMSVGHDPLKAVT